MRHSSRFAAIGGAAFGALLGILPGAALAGPNIMAVGAYNEMPAARAEGRDSFSGKEVIFSFDDPELDFGKVIVRSDSPFPTVRRAMFVGYSRGYLLIDAGRSQGDLQLKEIEIWLRIKGKLEPSRTYEWETAITTREQKINPFPAYIPMMWADGKQIAGEIMVQRPQIEPDKQTSRNPRGTVKIAHFERQAGAAWIVLKPKDFGDLFAIRFFSFREADYDIGDAEGTESDMPTPSRYIPIVPELESQIADAFQQGVEALEQRINREGFWGAEQGGEGAIQLTSMIVSVFAELGRPTKSGMLKTAMDWLAAQKPPPPLPDANPNDVPNFSVGTVATRLTCLARYGDLKDFSRAIRTDVDFLVNKQQDDGGWTAGEIPQGADPVTFLFVVVNAGAGGGTGATNRFTHSDNLASYMAIRGLQEAYFAGVPIEQGIWTKAASYWEKAQAYNGGFRTELDGYGGAGAIPSTGYTAMGIAALMITTDMAYGVTSNRCEGFKSNKAHMRDLQQGFSWMKKYYPESDFAQYFQSVVAPDPYCAPMFLTQLTAMTGIHGVNDRIVFFEAATELFTHQMGPFFGVARAEGPSMGRTIYALHTLATGAAPTIVQRIVVGGKDDEFAEFNFDATHIVRDLSKRRGRPFNWRRTSIDRDIRELVEVPILYLNVIGEPEWTDSDWKKIRAYCFAGGTVLLNFDEKGAAHRDKVLTALRQAMPEYELADLKQDDPFFADDKDKDDEKDKDKDDEKEAGALSPPKGLKVLGNGFRHFVFVPGESWSCIWQLNRKSDNQNAFAFVNRLVTYCTDGTPPRSSFVRSTYPLKAATTKKLAVHLIETGGTTPAYPDQLGMMDLLMEANYRVSIEKAGDVAKADMVWVAVTGEKEPSAEVTGKILEAVRGNKFLMIDIVSGNSKWNESFQAALRKMDPGISVERLRRNDPVFTGEMPGTQGFNVVQAALRPAVQDRHKFKEVFKLTHGRCDLYEIRFNGQPTGVYSGYDLSSGIGYHLFPKCYGAMPRSAREIVMNAALRAYQWKVRGKEGQS